MPAYSRSGTVATGTTTVTATCPTCLVGDILVLQVETNGTAATTPTGWTIQSVLTLAQRRQAVYTKLAIASDEAGTATYAVAGLTGGTTSAAQIHVITTSAPSSTLAVTVPVVGTDTSITTTAYSASGASQARTTGALLVCPYLVTSTTAVLTGVTATALTGTGGTVGTSTNQTFATQSGGLFGLGLATAPVTTGGTGAPKMALNGTGSATVGGVAHFLNITETAIPVGLVHATTLGLVTQQTSNKVIALNAATTLTATLPLPSTKPVVNSAGTLAASTGTSLVVTAPVCAVGDLLVLAVWGDLTSTTVTNWGTALSSTGVPAGVLIGHGFAKQAVAADVGGTQTYTIPMSGATNGMGCIYVIKASSTSYQAQVLEATGGNDDSGPSDNLIVATGSNFALSNVDDLIFAPVGLQASNMTGITFTSLQDGSSSYGTPTQGAQFAFGNDVAGGDHSAVAWASANVVTDVNSAAPSLHGTVAASPATTDAVSGALFFRITEYPIPELINWSGAAAPQSGGNPQITIPNVQMGESIYITLFADDGGAFPTNPSVTDNSSPGYTWTVQEGHVDANNNIVLLIASEVVPYSTPAGILVNIGNNLSGSVSGATVMAVKTAAGSFQSARQFHTGTNDTSGSPVYNKDIYGNAMTPGDANSEHVAFWHNAGDSTTMYPYHGWHEQVLQTSAVGIPGLAQSMRQPVAASTKAYAGAVTTGELFSGFHFIVKPPPTLAYLQHVTIQVPQNGTTVHACDPSNATGGGTVVGGAAFTPTAGKFLLAVCYGQVTFTTPSGWTLPTNGSAINNGGLYVFYKASAAGGDTFSTTQNGSNFPVVFDVYEFEAGTTFDVCASSTGVSVGSNGTGAGAGPTLTKSSSPSTVMSAVGGAISTTTGSNYFDWDNGFNKTADNYFTLLGNGYVFSVTEGDGITSTSLSDSASQNSTLATLGTAERLSWSLTPGTGGGGTETGIVGLAVATTLGVVPVDTLQPTVGLATVTTLGLVATREADATVALAAATALTVTPSATHQATIAIAAATTLGAVPIDTLQPTVALAAVTVLGAAPTGEHDAAVALVAATALSATPLATHQAAIALAAATTVATTPLATHQAVVTLSAATVLSLTPLATHQVVVLLAAQTTLGAVGANAKFLTSIASGGRYFLDQDGVPFLLRGDAPQYLFSLVSPTDMGSYLADRAGTHRVNTLWITVGNQTTFDGVQPYTDTHLTPNSTYWARVDAFLALAQSLGFTIFLDVMDQYAIASGPFNAATTTECGTYGTFLAGRYPQSSYPGIVWLWGNDYDYVGNNQDAKFGACRDAIIAAGDTRMHTVELDFSLSYSTDSTYWEARSNLNAVYTYYATYQAVLNSYNRTAGARDPRPAVFIEGAYEGASLYSRPYPSTSLDIRKQFGWLLTSGAAGGFTGQDPVVIASSSPDWKTYLDTATSAALTIMNDALAAQKWWTLVPDQSSALVVSGRNTQLTTNPPQSYDGTYATDGTYGSYVTAGVSPDGTLAVIYNPDTSANSITISATPLGSSPTITAIDPGDGTTYSLGWTTTPTKGANSLGDHDWLFVINAGAASSATVGLATQTTLGVVAQPTHQAAINLAAATALSVAPKREADATVGLATVTTLGAVPIDTLQPSVALAAATALALTPRRETDATVALAAATALALTAVPTHQALTALAAQTILAVAPVPTHQASINLAAATSLIVNVQTVYYVSAAGSDSNDGLTTSTPYLTIGKVNSKTLHAGDSVLFRGGDTFSDALLHLTGVGSTVNPITIGSYGTGKATLSFGTNNAVFLDGVGGYVFSNLNFTGISGSTGFAGVNCFTNGTGVRPALTFEACSFTGWQTGLQIGGESATDGYNGITIDSCDFSGNLYGGCSIFNVTAFVYTSPVYAHSNVSITNSTFDNNTGDASVTTIGTGSGLNVASVDGGVVTGCEAHGNGANNGDTTSGPVGIWVSESNNVVVSNCLAYSNHSGTSVDGDGFDLDQDCTNCVIEYCLSYGNDGAGILLYGGFADNGWANNTARYNVTFGNGQTNSSYSEMTLGGLIIGAQVYGNTCISKDGASTFPSPLLLQYSPGMTSCAIRNNLFYGTGFGDLAYDGVGGTTSQVEMQGNLYFSPHTTTVHWGTDYTSLAAWQTATGQEKLSGSAVGLMTDPKLVAPTTGPTVTSAALITGYTSAQLQAASPAFGAGLDLQALFSINPGLRDFYNNTLATPLPIGADDHVPVVSATVGLAVVTTLGVVAKHEADAVVGLAVATTLFVTPLRETDAVVAIAAATTLGAVPSREADAAVLLGAATTLGVVAKHEADATVALAAATTLAATPLHEADAVVALAAATVLGAAQQGTLNATIELDAVTVLALAPQVAYQGTVALAATTALLIAPSHEADATVAIAAATTLNAATQSERDATVALAAATVLSLTPLLERDGTVLLAAVTALSATPLVTHQAAVTLAAATALGVVTQVTYEGTVLIGAATALSTTVLVTHQAAVALAAQTVLGVVQGGAETATVGVAAATTLSLTVLVEHDAVVALAALTVLSLTPSHEADATITLAAATALSAAALVEHDRAVALVVATAVSLTPLITHQVVVAIAAATTLTAVIAGERDATMTLAAATALSLAPSVVHNAVVAMVAASTLSVTPLREADAIVLLAAATALGALGLVERDELILLATTTALTAITQGERDAAVALATLTALTLVPHAQFGAVVPLAIQTVLNVIAQVLPPQRTFFAKAVVGIRAFEAHGVHAPPGLTYGRGPSLESNDFGG